MALAPIQLISDFMEDYPNYWLKFYEQGTTTPLAMAIDSTGSPTVAKAEISAGPTPPLGLIKTAGNVTFIPYLLEAYDAYIFPTEAEADANDTVNAIQLADNVDPLGATDGALEDVTELPNLILDSDQVNYQAANNLSGGVDRTQENKNKDVVTVKDFGAVGDGVVDDTVALQAAFNASSSQHEIDITPGTYRTTATLTINQVGARIFARGIKNSVKILGDHNNGPVIQVLQREVIISGLNIDATASRYNGANANDTDHGLAVGGVGAGSLTNCRFENIIISNQPSMGMIMGGSALGTVVEQVAVLWPKGHGFFFDDGTRLGGTPVRNGIVRVTNCRAQDCGGNGINMSELNTSDYRYIVENLECFDNAWNGAVIGGLTDVQMYLGGENHRVSSCGFGDAGFADTVTGGGNPRPAKAGPGTGIEIRSSAGNIEIINNRFIGVIKSINALNSIRGLRIIGNYNNTLQAIGYEVGTGCKGLVVEVPDSTLMTDTLLSATGGGTLRDNNLLFEIYPDSLSHYQKNAVQFQTIVSGTVNVQCEQTLITGEGNVADSLSGIVFAGGSNQMIDGYICHLLNINNYVITIQHNVGNIFTKTGSNVALGQNIGITFMARGDNLYEV